MEEMDLKALSVPLKRKICEKNGETNRSFIGYPNEN